MLYERSRTVLPSLSVCPVENVLGRVPLIPCYLNGNTSITIPYRYRGAIPAEAAADSRPDSGTGSRLFEINISRWMWRYGRSFPREITVAEAETMRKQRVQESSLLAAKVRCCPTGPTLSPRPAPHLPRPWGQATHPLACPYSTDALGQSHTVSPSLSLSIPPHCGPPPPARAGLALLRRPAQASHSSAGPRRRRPRPPPPARTGMRRPSSLLSPCHVQRTHTHPCQRADNVLFGLQ